MRARHCLLLLGVLLMTVPKSAVGEGLQVPQYETVKLENGMTLLLLEHAVVPMVSVELWVRAGAVEDPADKAGLSALTAEALRKGAGDRGAAEFAEAVDFLGAQFGTSVNQDRVRISMNLLARDMETGMDLLADAVLRPAFDGDEIEKLRSQMAESIVQAKDNPRNVLGDYHAANLYGDHPYGSPVDGTETSLEKLSRGDVERFHRDYYGADRMILTVAGDIDAGEVRSMVEARFGDLKPAKEKAKAVPPPAPAEGNRVRLVNKTDTPQTWFRIGCLGPAFDHPDYAAAEVVRTVFGGRFTSWLNNKLRIETGLTYGASYQFNPWAQPGPAYISSFTATETTGDALKLAMEQLDRLHTEGIGAEDLASAKAYMKGQSPYDYETAADLAGALTQLEYYGVSRDRLDSLFRAIDDVTVEDCRAAIQKYFQRENLVITAIGVEAEVKDVLAEYGELTVRENSEPGFH